MYKVYLLIVIVIATLSGCYYDKEEQIYPLSTNQCDSSNIKYSTTIVNLLSAHCLSCHGDTYNSVGGGIDLRTYNDVKKYNDKTWGSINLLSGYAPMPKNSSKLDDCLISQYRIWNTAGSLNN